MGLLNLITLNLYNPFHMHFSLMAKCGLRCFKILMINRSPRMQQKEEAKTLEHK